MKIEDLRRRFKVITAEELIAAIERGESCFSGVCIVPNADGTGFGYHVFHTPVVLDLATFGKGFPFDHAYFEHGLIIDGALFLGDLDFKDVTVDEELEIEAVVEGDARLKNTKGNLDLTVSGKMFVGENDEQIKTLHLKKKDHATSSIYEKVAPATQVVCYA